MATKTEAGKPELKLSCREAQLVLRLIPLRKNVKDMREEEIAAIKHYLYCKSCRDRGLDEVLDKTLSCQEAPLVWAEHPWALWLDFIPGARVERETLIQEQAVEHVWGKYQWGKGAGGHGGYDNFTACQERPCQALRVYWLRVPMSSGAGDGPEGPINLIPFLIEVFLREGWPLDELLAIQKKRMEEVLESLREEDPSIGHGHYHFMHELVAEVQANIEALQKLVAHSQKEVVTL